MGEEWIALPDAEVDAGVISQFSRRVKALSNVWPTRHEEAVFFRQFSAAFHY
jgi:hypothetical protein